MHQRCCDKLVVNVQEMYSRWAGQCFTARLRQRPPFRTADIARVAASLRVQPQTGRIRQGLYCVSTARCHLSPPTTACTPTLATGEQSNSLLLCLV
jgi:hypothetical protein